MITAGLDIGSVSTKAVILEGGQILAAQVVDTGYNPAEGAKRVLEEALFRSNLSFDSVERIVATGYGRKSAFFAHQSVTEITCHAAGASFLVPGIRFVIDIGGQDSKAILLSQEGKVLDFIMNDKCAAGTGRFLEVMARALGVPLADLGDMSEQARRPAKISSMCTVFAESEVVSLIARGEGRENIIAGIHEAISSRVVAMASRLGLARPIMLTGGVAKNKGVERSLSFALGEPVVVSPYAQLSGAIGAALLAQTG